MFFVAMARDSQLMGWTGTLSKPLLKLINVIATSSELLLDRFVTPSGGLQSRSSHRTS